MITYPNQRILCNAKYSKCDSDNYYMKLNLLALEKAMIRLNNPSSLKLFLYLSKNQESYKYAISSKDIMTFCGISKNAYLRAWNELEDKGYLIKKGNNRDYEFIQEPELT